MAIIIIRTLIVYSILLITMRLLGKRQLGEMELSEFILAALIADLAANPLQDIGIPMINGLAPIAVLFCCELMISSATVKSVKLRALLFGRPCMLIENGRINRRELERSCYTLDELMQQLRAKGCLDISHVEYAVLETDGSVNVLPFPEHMPATAGQLGIASQTGAYPTILINDGRVIENNLQLMGRDMRWLSSELKSRGVSDAREVFLMTLDRAGGIYFAAKEQDE